VTGPTVVGPPNGQAGRVILTGGPSKQLSVPAMNRQFSITPVYDGNTALASIAVPAASLIAGGSYFVFQASPATNILQQYYVWFKVAGVGVDPKPPAVSGLNQTAIPVVLTGTETEPQVAAAIVAAALVVPSVPLLGSIQSGPCALLSGGTAVASTYAGIQAYNPAVGGVADNYLGSSNGAVVAPIAGTSFGVVGVGYSSYNYEAVYEWVDGQGQLHQSAPSVPLVTTVPGYAQVGTGSLTGTTTAFNTGVLQISVPNYRTTQKANVGIAYYRTQTSGNTFYRESSAITPILSSLTVDYSTFTSQVPDATLSGLQLIYTTGGVNPYAGPPACGWCSTVGDRLWLTQLEDPLLYWFSNYFTNGSGVAWSTTQTQRLDQAAGPSVAVSVLDTNVLLFGSNQIYLMNGSGPDATGNGSFNGPTVVSNSLGARDPNSIIQYDQGVIFKSGKGFWNLDRAGNLIYIGVDVEGYNSDIVTDGLVVPGTTEIRFLSATGTTLVYDYLNPDTSVENVLSGNWGPYTNHQGMQSIVYNGLYYYRRNNGQVYYETPGVYGDNGVGYGFYFASSWLKGDGKVKSLKRFWEFLIKGYFTGLNPIQVTINANYSGTIATYSPPPYNPATGLELWGFSAGTGLWGSDTVWGGSTTPATYPPSYQFRIKNQFQQAEAIQLVIQELPPFPITTAAALDSIDIEIGMKIGGVQLGGGQTIG
jgi:hypothetical protein